MVATLTKEVEDVVVVEEQKQEQERLRTENTLVLRGAADAISGLSTAGMDSVYGKVLEDMMYP